MYSSEIVELIVLNKRFKTIHLFVRKYDGNPEIRATVIRVRAPISAQISNRTDFFPTQIRELDTPDLVEIMVRDIDRSINALNPLVSSDSHIYGWLSFYPRNRLRFFDIFFPPWPKLPQLTIRTSFRGYR